jgi:alpha-D-ribose 1-methylphosphonate 5-triphosphate synthase subunit PhnG
MTPPPNTADRQRWMSVLARAEADTLRAHLADAPALPACTTLRGPEVGMVMLRGRAGGTGQRFNLGEATVTRCTVRSDSGAVGHAYVLGRDAARAELAARIDAAMQDPTLRPALDSAVIAPLAAAQAEARDTAARQAAATRVDFFTMATMRS